MWNRTLSEDALVVNGVSDGQTAIERAAELQPDLVILGSSALRRRWRRFHPADSKRSEEARPPHSDSYSGGQRFAGQPSPRRSNRDRLPCTSLQSADASIACSFMAGTNDGVRSRKHRAESELNSRGFTSRARRTSSQILASVELLSVTDAGTIRQAPFRFIPALVSDRVRHYPARRAGSQRLRCIVWPSSCGGDTAGQFDGHVRR